MSELGDRILALRKQGMTYTQIVKKTGASKSTVSYYCGEGQKVAKNNRMVESRKKISEYIWAIKEASPCMDCGKNYPYWIMDFDHVRGEKLFNLSKYRYSGASIKKVQEEIDKCDLVCANCHRDRTHSRRSKPMV